MKLSESLLPKMSVTVMAAVCSPGEKSSTSISSISKPTGGEIKCFWQVSHFVSQIQCSPLS